MKKSKSNHPTQDKIKYTTTYSKNQGRTKTLPCGSILSIIGSEGEVEKANAFYISTERTNFIVPSYIIGSEGEVEKANAFYISTERTNFIVFSYIIK